MIKRKRGFKWGVGSGEFEVGSGEFEVGSLKLRV
jgi:hypothetical protein